MQTLDIKRGHYKNLEEIGLQRMMEEAFGDVQKDGDKLKANYGAMKPITVWIKSKKELCVDIATDANVTDEEAMKTIKAKNDFLLSIPGDL